MVTTRAGDAALRIRVERLMHGEFKVEDLTTLFLAPRDRAGGRQSIVEVGAFVAHREERYKGIVTDAVRDFFARIRFVVESYERPPKAHDLPPYVAEFLKASARHMDYTAAKKTTTYTRINVGKALPGLLSHIRSSNGRCYLWPSVTDDELKLFDFLAGTMRFKPLFTEAELFRDFTDALRVVRTEPYASVRSRSRRRHKRILGRLVSTKSVGVGLPSKSQVGAPS